MAGRSARLDMLTVIPWELQNQNKKYMNLINSVNIQIEKDNSEILLGFAKPKTNREAMDRAERAIQEETGKSVTEVRRCAPQYKNTWTAYGGNGRTKLLGWMTLNEITVAG